MPGPIHAYAVPSHVPADALRGGVAVVIDQLRASTTICAALAQGAAGVRPCLTPEEAMAFRAAADREAARGGRVLLGGERDTGMIAGFDLGNRPSEYTRERVAGRTIAFTTTNGTKAVLHAREEGAARIVVGCLANAAAVAETLAGDPRPIHLVCAGTGGESSMEDLLAAGAIAAGLISRGREPWHDDAARFFALCYRAVAATPGGLLEAMVASRGGRNLGRFGLGDDVVWSTVVDRLSVVPELETVSGRFRAAAGTGHSA